MDIAKNNQEFPKEEDMRECWGDCPDWKSTSEFKPTSGLSPVISEGLKKFKEVFKNCEHGGYPDVFELSETSKKALGDDTDYHEKVSKDLWLTVIDEMIYAFDTDEPKLVPHGEIGLTDEEYNAECANHEAKCRHGREQFARYYEELSPMSHKLNRQEQ